MKSKFYLFSRVLTLLLFFSLFAFASACGDTKPEYEFPDGNGNGNGNGNGGNEDKSFKTEALTGYPSGLNIYAFTHTFDDGKTCSGYYAVADPKANPKIKFNTVSSAASAPSAIFASYTSQGRGVPYVAINGGFFYAGSSLSLLVDNGVVKSIENQVISRTGAGGGKVNVYPLRSSFGEMSDGTFEAHWIYCVLDDGNRPYAFSSAMGNNEQTKTFMSAPPTSKTEGGSLWQPRNAIGGGPRLVKEGVNVAVASYWGECLEEGGIGGTSRQPRTAIGATADGKIVLFVCDGRSMNGSAGYTLSEMADRLIALGVVTAVNLDGGGSSTFVGREGKVLNRPSDSGASGVIVERKVPTAVVITLAE